MKTIRLFTCLMVFMLVFSAWTPSTAYAASAGIGANSPSASSSVAKMVKLTVFNKTGGPLSVSLQGGPQPYYFYVPNQGKTTFMILSGRYQFTVVGCGGSAYTRNRNFKGGGSIGPMICTKK